MSDKKANATTEELAEVAIDEKKENPIDDKVILIRQLPPLGFVRGDFTVVGLQPHVDYPPSRTDQVHNVSISDMIKQGQGEISETDINNFDFKAGEKDDGRDVKSMQEMEWADPAERFEQEVALHNEITTAIRQEAHEKAMALAVKRKKKSSAQPAQSTQPAQSVQSSEAVE